MAATSQGKSRARLKARTGAMKRKSTVKLRNVPAAALADPRYHKRVVKSVKAYSRKSRTPIAEDEDT